MPKAKVIARGGAVRTRTKRLPNGDLLVCDITREPGPRGGRTVCTVRRRKAHR